MRVEVIILSFHVNEWAGSGGGGGDDEKAEQITAPTSSLHN